MFSVNDLTLEFLKILILCAENFGAKVYIVGGYVRDNLLNLENSSKDIDIIINKNALDFVKILPPEIKLKSIHKDFYTAKVEYKAKTFDIASTRVECYPYSACLPQVVRVGVPIDEDFKRRDFTLNSMYYELSIKDDKINFELIDLTDGVNDLKNKTLKVLHDKSYTDDVTRILRGLDFKYRFGFDFSRHDMELIKNCLNSLNLEHASKDRILAVFRNTFLNDKQDEILKEVLKNVYFKLLEVENTDFDYLEILSCAQKFSLLKEDKADFYLKVLKNEQIQALNLSLPHEIKSAFQKFNMAELCYYFYKTKDENALKYLKYKDIKLDINGDDLIKQGFRGKEIGEKLNSLFDKKVQDMF